MGRKQEDREGKMTKTEESFLGTGNWGNNNAEVCLQGAMLNLWKPFGES